MTKKEISSPRKNEEKNKLKEALKYLGFFARRLKQSKKKST